MNVSQQRRVNNFIVFVANLMMILSKFWKHLLLIND